MTFYSAIEKNYMAFYVDTETSGLPRKSYRLNKYNYRTSGDFDSARIVSIAWILEVPGERVERHFVIKPESFDIPEAASRIHGITTERAHEVGVPFATMAVQLLEDLSRADLVIAHNVKFDKAVLKSELFRRGHVAILQQLKRTAKYCTMLNAYTLMRLHKWPKLSELYAHLTGKTADPEIMHSANGDVLYCYECYSVLKNMFASKAAIGVPVVETISN